MSKICRDDFPALLAEEDESIDRGRLFRKFIVDGLKEKRAPLIAAWRTPVYVGLVF